ncbi:hypothetical protein [uncultured Pseudacidovorax sp.]|uniref:hypothetical protein n=1 Tax=uncultured Pseudacidovorax sp. TaxID=679313 RepID=UPI0025DEDDD5|nr:hypothetical protein [uncultured Pseudacidovorax sp.]
MHKSARIWLSVFMTGFAVIVALFLVTLFTQPAEGGLTRIGRVSEDAFGWRSTPPEIPIANVRGWAPADADILVIGDSFSMYYAWQSPLVAAGYKVSTTHWDRSGPLCADFSAWLESIGFKGRMVILESIERLLPERLAQAQGCKTMARRPLKALPVPTQSPAQPPPGFRLNWESPLMTGLLTYLNTRQILETDGVVDVEHERFGDYIFSSPVAEGCRQFSSRVCGKSLFLTADRTNRELQPQDADFMAAFARRAEPVKVMWMVVPNKTTVYLDTHNAGAFARRSNALGVGPDLFAMAQDQRLRIIDLYWPNDTHWSMQGQLYFGKRMVDAVRTAGLEPLPR